MIDHTFHDSIARETERLDAVRTAAERTVALLRNRRAERC
jgi:hypothetical protein